MSTHNMFSWRNKKNIMWVPSLIRSYDYTVSRLIMEWVSCMVEQGCVCVFGGGGGGGGGGRLGSNHTLGGWRPKRLSQRLFWLPKILFCCNTVLNLPQNIRTPQLLTLLVLKFEQLQFTTNCCV